MISIKNVNKWYGNFQVLTECSTEVKKGEVESFHKSRAGELSWRTCHDKLNKKGVFKGLGI